MTFPQSGATSSGNYIITGGTADNAGNTWRPTAWANELVGGQQDGWVMQEVPWYIPLPPPPTVRARYTNPSTVPLQVKVLRGDVVLAMAEVPPHGTVELTYPDGPGLEIVLSLLEPPPVPLPVPQTRPRRDPAVPPALMREAVELLAEYLSD
jgi:hypothetical protein